MSSIDILLMLPTRTAVTANKLRYVPVYMYRATTIHCIKKTAVILSSMKEGRESCHITHVITNIISSCRTRILQFQRKGNYFIRIVEFGAHIGNSHQWQFLYRRSGSCVRWPSMHFSYADRDYFISLLPYYGESGTLVIQRRCKEVQWRESYVCSNWTMIAKWGIIVYCQGIGQY